MLLGFSSLLTAVAALVVVLGLVWLGARAARLTGLAPRPTGARMLALQDSIALDSRRRLLVVRCGARDVVLLTGGAQDLVVGWLPQQSPVVAGQSSDGVAREDVGGGAVVRGDVAREQVAREAIMRGQRSDVEPGA
jgi:flagellar protein FliO/FliZ